MAEKDIQDRQRMEMKRKTDEKTVSFFKRKSSINNKASELVAKCGAKVAVVILSRTGYLYCYAHPSLESITNRFTGESMEMGYVVEPSGSYPLGKMDQQSYERANELKAEMVEQMFHQREIEQKINGRKGEGWWEAPMEDLDIHKIHQNITSFRELQKAVDTAIESRNGRHADALNYVK